MGIKNPGAATPGFFFGCVQMNDIFSIPSSCFYYSTGYLEKQIVKYAVYQKLYSTLTNHLFASAWLPF